MRPWKWQDKIYYAKVGEDAEIEIKLRFDSTVAVRCWYEECLEAMEYVKEALSAYSVQQGEEPLC